MTVPEKERLERRAQALNVSVKSLKACKHLESLIYFDKVYGLQASWQVCDYCEQEFNYTVLEAPHEIQHDYTRLQALDGGTIHDHV